MTILIILALSVSYSSFPSTHLIQVYELQNTLEDTLRQWDNYHHAAHKVNHIILDTQYALGGFQIASGDLKSFNNQLKQLKVPYILSSEVFINFESYVHTSN